MSVKKYTITINECKAKYRTSKVYNAEYLSKELIMEMFSECLYSHEEIYAIYLTNSLEIRSFEKIGMGAHSAVVADIHKIIVSMAMQKARRVILIHNHPSGNKQFSDMDLKLANKIKEGMLFLDMELVDFLVVTTDFEIVSAKEKGLL